MKCNSIIQNYLKQEDSIYLSPLTRLHILFCNECKKEIRTLQEVFIAARMTSPFSIPKDMSDLVMHKITKIGIVYEKSISSSRWLFSGAIIFISIFMLSYSESLIWLRKHFGRELEIPLNIVLGLVITFYAVSFIATHLDGAKKIAEFINNKIHQ